jgi:hypothetical protein
MNMLSFELSAIDIILVTAVIVLFMLYWSKLSNIPDKKIFRGIMTRNTTPEKVTPHAQKDYTECPRGFGNIKRIASDGSVSEKCLGCYRIMECYSETEAIKSQLSRI